MIMKMLKILVINNNNNSKFLRNYSEDEDSLEK